MSKQSRLDYLYEKEKVAGLDKGEMWEMIELEKQLNGGEDE